MPFASGFGDTLEAAILDKEFGAVDYTPPATHYVGLHTASPGDAGPGSELSGGGYARVAYTNNAGNWQRTGNSKSNANAITFPVATADQQRATHWAIYATNVATEPRAYGELLGPGKTVSAVDTSTDTLTSAGHGLSNGDRVKVRSEGAVPAGLSEATTYYVVGATTNTLQLSLTSGGAAVNLTDAGYGTITVHLDKSKAAEAGDTLSFGAGELVITLE